MGALLQMSMQSVQPQLSMGRVLEILHICYQWQTPEDYSYYQLTHPELELPDISYVNRQYRQHGWDW